MTCQEGDELVASALGAESDSDGVQALDGVQAEVHILVLQLVDQHRHRKQVLRGASCQRRRGRRREHQGDKGRRRRKREREREEKKNRREEMKRETER